VEVARLAGLPLEVVARAREILAQLENGSGSEPKAAAARARDPQIPLFEPPPHPALARLRALDTDAITPLEALNRLAELTRLANESS
jgi:DNA mismatch repair protein MutS